MARITGINSGLDVDALVKASMTTYQSKIDKEAQNKKVLEYQQEQYKKIISDAANFYDKYFDILKTGNLMSTNSYQSVSFKSGDDTKVTAKGFAGASVDDYTVSVTQLASKATANFSKINLDKNVISETGETTGLLYVNMGATEKGLDVYVDLVVTEKKESDGTYKDSNGIQIYKQSNGKFVKKDSSGNFIDNSEEQKRIYQQSDGSFSYDLEGTSKLENDNYAKPQYEVDMQKTADNLNKQLAQNNINITAKYSEYSGGIVLESGEMGANVKFSAIIASTDNDKKASKLSCDEKEKIVKSANVSKNIKAGTDLEGTIKKVGIEDTSYPLKGNSNTITVDKVQFSFKAPTTTGTPVTLSGSTDVTTLKDKIVSFVNDYNTLLSSINTKIYETRDKDYMPLSDEQKKEMTDDQIEKWEKKAQTGLIRKDMDLERITSAMKSAMSTVISGSGLTLESIGIKPVANYSQKNGMFTIDEATLTKALEENAGNIKDLFTRVASEDGKGGGIFTQLAATLKSEFKSSTASLSKKAGIDGTSTQYSNTITKSIAKKKTLIEELNYKFSVKETALYKKYSALETALEKLNSQQASLSSMLGTS